MFGESGKRRAGRHGDDGPGPRYLKPRGWSETPPTGESCAEGSGSGPPPRKARPSATPVGGALGSSPASRPSGRSAGRLRRIAAPAPLPSRGLPGPGFLRSQGTRGRRRRLPVEERNGRSRGGRDGPGTDPAVGRPLRKPPPLPTHRPGPRVPCGSGSRGIGVGGGARVFAGVPHPSRAGAGGFPAAPSSRSFGPGPPVPTNPHLLRIAGREDSPPAIPAQGGAAAAGGRRWWQGSWSGVSAGGRESPALAEEDCQEAPRTGGGGGPGRGANPPHARGGVPEDFFGSGGGGARPFPTGKAAPIGVGEDRRRPRPEGGMRPATRDL